MRQFPGYTIIEQIDETFRSVIYRARVDGAPGRVVIKTLKADNPSAAEIARLKHEYALIRDIDIDGIIKPLDALEIDGNIALVLEDFEGISLGRIISGGLELERFLALAVRLADILGNLHQAGITHRDIKPSNILINWDKDIVKLTDFGIASEITRQHDEIYNPWVIQGTLAYISPEQTGRMNCPVDYRSDLYSLGITFYEMLTGSVPFMSKDPMEIIHAHIARAPIPPHTHRPDIPTVVSDIVMKLLAKAPEERYQNSFGLQADLRVCLSQLYASNRIEPFDLARQDVSIRFIIPQMLVGREAELEALKQAFDRINAARAELMLVAGEPGIGKSALIQEIHKPIVAKRGYFLSGKYEELRRHLPYSGIIQAFQGLARQILSESEDRLKVWRQTISAALGENAKVITDAIPEMEYILGPRPNLPEMGPEETRNRFNLAFKNFVRVFADRTHPLVLFLDDLQWADPASLNLIQTIATDPDLQHMLIIGAYRDNEVPSHHPLMLVLDAIRKTGLGMHTITLGPLRVADINQLIVSFLKNPPQVSLPLAEVIHDKTKGNPFFVTQFIKMLYSDHHIVLNPKSGWSWDIDIIKSLKVTENVVEFLAEKIGGLEPGMCHLLKIGACIGNRFDAETIASLTGNPLEEILSTLDTLILEGFIHRKGDLYRFHHDRIQEAAYSLLSEEERMQLHHWIGLLGLGLTPPDEIFNQIFFIVDHLNKAQPLLKSSEEKLRLADLNLKAGIKAKDSTAYHAAARYLQTGIDLLPETAWTNEYELAYALHLQQMECLYLDRNFDAAERLFEIIKLRAATPTDKARAYKTMVVLYTTIRPPREALALGLEGLRLLGVNLSMDVGPGPAAIELIKAKHGIRKIGLEHILDLPRMQDKYLLTVHDLLLAVGFVAYYVNPNLFAQIALRGVNASLRYGHTPHSAIAFMAMAVIVGGSLNDFDLSYRLGEMALKLNEKLDNRKIAGDVQHIFAFMIQHWKKHAKEDIEIHRKVFEQAFNAGDFFFAGHSVTATAYCRILIGHNPDDVLDELNKYRDFMAIMQDPLITSQYKLMIVTALTMKGMSAPTQDRRQEASIIAGDLDKFRRERNYHGLCFGLYGKVLHHFMQEEYEEARVAAAELDKHIKVPMGTLLVQGHYFYYSLILTALIRKGEKRNALKYRLIIARNQRKLKQWTALCPINFEHKYHLVAAELAAIDGKFQEAMRLYHLAIEEAHKNEYPPEEAVACQLTAEFYEAGNYRHEARTYLTLCHQIHCSIGAMNRAMFLEEKHPFLKRREKNYETDSTFETTFTGTTSTLLDLSTVMQVSQAISSEIMLDRLLQKVMHMFITNAGAQRGFLILESDGRLTIEASEEVQTGEVRVLQSEALETCEKLARTIVHYVYRSGQDLIIANAVEEGSFQHDAYIQKHACKSILCAPIMNKGKLTGLLYMENNLIVGAFTPERLKLLRIISAQAAISLENARLFELATTDGLTKLFVHRYFQLLLDQEIHNHQRFKRPFSIVIIDIDDFKAVNDTYGHQTGDKVLRHVARAIKNNTRAVDVAARYGGEEFVLILPETDVDNARVAAEKIRGFVEHMEIAHGHETIRVTISAGVAAFPRHAGDKQSLIRSADGALYIAKRSGKNRLCVAENIVPR